MFKKFLPFSLLLLALPLVAGCLTAEHKEVHISLDENGKSGSGRILFINVASEGADSLDVTREDFNSLITDYYQGKRIESENRGMRNVKKRLFMQGGKLNGELTFNFDDIADLGIYRYKSSGPYMYYTIAEGFFTSGQYEASNGTYGGEKMPMVFWEPDQRELFVRMQLSTPQEERKPLASLFQDWETGKN